MSKITDASSGRFLFQAFFIGLAFCGFLVILIDLLARVPGISVVVEPLAVRFFPEVENGLGLLISSLVLLGIGYLPSVFESKA